ncbi:MXD [Mytilus coruscus]|uniref:MXD n=1 Tax=Mytilus coruscus TaxID=42192 RepID=A0A6J8CCZ2_MYTCO|nr:MXD [Mytilus coruscus]
MHARYLEDISSSDDYSETDFDLLLLFSRHVKADIDLKLLVKGYKETLNTMLRQMYGERTGNPSESDKEEIDLDGEKSSDILRAFYDIGWGIHLLAESDVSNIIQAIRWKSDDFQSFYNEDTTLKNYKLETDFFKIEAKDPNDKENFPKNSSGMITVMALLPNDINYSCLQLKAYIKVGQTWNFVEASLKEKSVTFQTVKIDAFCIVSNPIKEQVHISPDGCKYVSKTDKRIQIEFPPGTVEKEDLICLHVVPVDKQILRRKYEERSKKGEAILAISDCLYTTGDKHLKKKVQVKLPLNDIGKSNKSDEDYVCRLFRQNTNGEFTLTDTVVNVDENNTAVFETDKISGTSVSMIGKEELKKGPVVISGNIEEMHGFKSICKVVFFVSDVTSVGLTVLLACIEKSKMQAFRHICEEMGFHLYKNWTSKDLVFKPQNKINITLKGCFSLPRFSTRKRLDLTFLPYSSENFTRFEVEIKPKIDQDVYGILLLTKDQEIVDEIMFNTQRTKEYSHGSSFKGKKKPDQKTGLPVKKTVSRGKSFVNRKPTSSICQYSENDFLTEKGVLAVAKVLNAEKIFETVLHLDMKRVQIDQICEKIPNSSRQSFELLQTALDQ